MSVDRKRWAQRAQELRFTQLETARRQAEGWRTGLAGMTALFGAVLVVKGRDNVAGLTPAFRWLVVLTLGAALGLLVRATLLAVRACWGEPGEECLLSGEDLRAWTAREVIEITHAIRRAARLAVASVVALAFAVACTWLGPSGQSDRPLFLVEHDAVQTCGALISSDHGRLRLATDGPQGDVVIPLAAVVSMELVQTC